MNINQLLSTDAFAQYSIAPNHPDDHHLASLIADARKW